MHHQGTTGAYAEFLQLLDEDWCHGVMSQASPSPSTSSSS
jgi:hypothetical protein